MAFGRFARSATRIIKKLHTDVVFATSTPLTVGIPGMKGARYLGVPFVFEVRDLWPEAIISLGYKNPAVIWYLRRLGHTIYHAAHRIIALSFGIKEGICRTGYPDEHVTVVPNSSDIDLFKPCADKTLDERFGAPNDFRLIVTGANGLDAVLDAAAELKRRVGAGIKFVFTGQGRERERLIQRSRDEGLHRLFAGLIRCQNMSWLRYCP